jgi:hypothetical protein
MKASTKSNLAFIITGFSANAIAWKCGYWLTDWQYWAIVFWFEALSLAGLHYARKELIEQVRTYEEFIQKFIKR